MIQATPPATVLYASRLLPGPPGQRIAHAVQSQAAADLLQEIATSTSTYGAQSSKSHSRALMAAALAQEGRVGIDVEYLAAPRPIIAIVRYLSGVDARDKAAAYRAFTFCEAYFKAMGAMPERALVAEIACAETSRYRVGDNLNVLHATPAPDFQLTLVWTGPGEARRIEL